MWGTVLTGSLRYDALTIDNRVRYQNGITDANKPFFDVSDGIFTNYWWREHNICGTADIAAALGRPRDVFSGVDVWGRGSLGDGGFNVGEVRSPCWKDTCIMLNLRPQALDSIQRHGLAAAIFAPGWTFEYLGAERFRENERKFWVGDPYRSSAGAGFGPIAQYSKLLACGTSDFFYTNFSRGFGKVWRVGGEVCMILLRHVESRVPVVGIKCTDRPCRYSSSLPFHGSTSVCNRFYQISQGKVANSSIGIWTQNIHTRAVGA